MNPSPLAHLATADSGCACSLPPPTRLLFSPSFYMSRGGNAISPEASRSRSPATRFDDALREETNRRHEEARRRYRSRSRSHYNPRQDGGLVLISSSEVLRKERAERLLESIGYQVENIRVSPSRLKVETLLETVAKLGGSAGIGETRARQLLEKGVRT